jgi:UDP-N-acetylmuramate dehydrogenase
LIYLVKRLCYNIFNKSIHFNYISSIIFAFYSYAPMITLHEYYSLKKHNSFGIDAKASFFAEADSEADLMNLLHNDPVPRKPVMILGEGTNVLFVRDFDGLIIHPKITGIKVIKEDNHFAIVRVGAAENWDNFVQWAVEKNLGGIENLSRIPGSVGASPVQNIGAYGCEASEVIEYVETLDIPDGISKTFRKDECNFGYRTSIFKTELKDRVIITYVSFRLLKKHILKTDYGVIRERLKKYDTPSIGDLRKVINDIRNEKLPDPEKIGNAGSFFKNPVLIEDEFRSFILKYPDAPNFRTDRAGFYKIPAAWLIEQCGWKGKRVGNAGTYPLQPLVLVNYGDATGQEIYELSENIRKDVFNKFNITLEREVNLAGISS